MSDLGPIEQRVATLERELAELKARPSRRRLGKPLAANAGDVCEFAAV